MIRRHYLPFYGILLFVIVTGCRESPQFVNHSPPALSVDAAAFADVGCSGEGYYRECHDDSPLAALGCDVIEAPSDLLGGLDPSYPIVRCVAYPGWERGEGRPVVDSEDESFFTVGGEMVGLVRYVIFRDGQFELIEAEDEFRGIFAPITSDEEALGYVLAVRKLSAYYDLAAESGYEYFVEDVEDTHVEKIADGFVVHLFDYEKFGCGPHRTYAVDVRVSTDGYVEEVKREAIYKDPSQDNLCVD